MIILHFVVFVICSGHPWKYLVFLDRWNEHGELYVPDLSQTVPGTVRQRYGKVRVRAEECLIHVNQSDKGMDSSVERRRKTRTGILTWHLVIHTQKLTNVSFVFLRSQPSPITSKRIHNIIDYLTYEVWRYSCRGLYENHKFLFTLLLALKIDLQNKKVSDVRRLTLVRKNITWWRSKETQETMAGSGL